MDPSSSSSPHAAGPSRRGSISGSPAAAATDPQQLALMVQQMAQAMSGLQQQLQALQQAPPLHASSPSPPPGETAAGMADAIGRAIAAAQPLALPLFDGAGNTSGIAAHAWLRQVERAFVERQASAGQSALSDARCIAAAAAALRGAAEAWYSALPLPPTTWDAWKAALLSRFQPANARLLIEGKLHALVEATAKFRERLNANGLDRYTAQFQQLAGQVPAEMMTERAKVLLYARGLPQRMRELVAQEEEQSFDSKKPMELNAIAAKILKRAAIRETASSSAGPPASASSGSNAGADDAMDLSAIELCRRAFELSAAEARDYLEPAEGWAPHDTTPAGSGSSCGPSSARTSELEQQVHALQAQLAALGPVGRRSVQPVVKKEVPEQLAADRRAAGLCIRCGVAKYEAGGKGHNSRTCKLPCDLSTPASIGAKRAGLQVFQ
jgi:hypothetical protein